jgi:hypothetical protein
MTLVPSTVKPRKSRGFIALCLTGALALSGGGVALVTLATQSAKATTSVTWATELLGVTTTEAIGFKLTPGAVSVPQYINVTNTGGSGINAHASFAPKDFMPSVPAALEDTEVRVWDATKYGNADPSVAGDSPYWEGTLGDFLDTSYIAEAILRGGQSHQFGIAVATPYDVDANKWLMDNLSESVNNSEAVTLLVQADLDNQSPLSRGSVYDSATGLRTASASLVLDAAAALNDTGSVPASPAWTDDTETFPGSIVRTFYTDPSYTTLIGSILLDASANEGDPGQILDADYDADGTDLALHGLIQAG